MNSQNDKNRIPETAQGMSLDYEAIRYSTPREYETQAGMPAGSDRSPYGGYAPAGPGPYPYGNRSFGSAQYPYGRTMPSQSASYPYGRNMPAGPAPYQDRNNVPGPAAMYPYNEAAPAGSKKKKLRAWQGILCYIIVMALFYFVLPVPLYLLSVPPVPSILLQQLFLLAGSVLFVAAVKADMREVFPLRRPSFICMLGVLVLYIGAWLLETAIGLFLQHIAPEEIQEVSDSLFGGISGAEYVIYLILISVLPAVCEEALNRGVVLNGLQNDIRRKWVVILVSGLLFGIGHFTPVRMVAPAVLGFLMAWLVLETGNLFYSGLLHLLNNGLILLLSSVLQLLIPQEMAEQSMDAAASLGAFETGLGMMAYGLLGPLIIYCGCFIIRRSVHGPSEQFVRPGRGKQAAALIVLPAAAVLLTGCLLVFSA